MYLLCVYRDAANIESHYSLEIVSVEQITCNRYITNNVMRTISLILEEENIRTIKEKMDKGESFIKIDKKIEQIPQSLTSEIIRALIVENEIGVLKSIINSYTSFVNSLLPPSNKFPLSIAMDADYEKIVELLLSNGANMLSIISDMPDKYKNNIKMQLHPALWIQ